MTLLSFDLFASLFDRIDGVTQAFVTDISQKAIVAITPVLTVGLTLAFIAYGLLIIRGAVEMPVTEFVMRSLRIAIILSIALAGGLYQAEIAGLIGPVTDDLAASLAADPESARNAGGIIDQAAENGYLKAAEAFGKGGVFTSDGIAYYVLGACVFLTTAFLIAAGGAFIVLAKVALAVLAGLGPLFIAALLFQATHRFFDLWLGQVVNYGILVVLFAVVFGLIMAIYGDYVGDISFDGTQNVWFAVGGVAALGLASAVIVLQLPAIASGLAGGVGLSYYWELRSLRSMGGSAARGVGSAARGAATAGRAAYHTPGAARAGAAWAGINARQGARAVAGYYRSRMGGGRR
jgi:type IV secretion system protein VirB6